MDYKNLIPRASHDGAMGQQTAIEFLSTYSWALLVIALVVAIVFLLSFSTPAANYLPSTCYIEPLLPCQATLLTSYVSASEPITYTVVLTNNLGNPIYFASNAINVTVTNLGSTGQNSFMGACTPRFALVGAQILCKTTITGTYQPSLGTRINTLFRLNYTVCASANQSTCGKSSYITSGYATQSFVSPTSSALYTANVITKLWSWSGNTVGAGGVVRITGIPYSNGSLVSLPTGSYTIYGQAAPGDNFVSFAVNSPSTLGNSVPPNALATLTLNANTQIVSAFTTAQCYTLYTAGSPECPASCPYVLTTSTSTPASTTAVTSTINPVSTQHYYSCNSCTLPLQGYSCPSSCPSFASGGPCPSSQGQCVTETGGVGFSGPDPTAYECSATPPTYTLTTAVSLGAGTSAISPTAGTHTTTQATPTSISETPGTGYAFTGWTCTGSDAGSCPSGSGTTSFSLPTTGSDQVTADFAANCFSGTNSITVVDYLSESVPYSITTVSYTMYGGGGGGAASSTTGAAGFSATGSFSITAGQTLTIYAGGGGGGGGNWGGAAGGSGYYGGGGGGASLGYGAGGGGGGSSAIFVGGVLQASASGGNGASAPSYGAGGGGGTASTGGSGGAGNGASNGIAGGQYLGGSGGASLYYGYTGGSGGSSGTGGAGGNSGAGGGGYGAGGGGGCNNGSYNGIIGNAAAGSGGSNGGAGAGAVSCAGGDGTGGSGGDSGTGGGGGNIYGNGNGGNGGSITLSWSGSACPI